MGAISRRLAAAKQLNNQEFAQAFDAKLAATNSTVVEFQPWGEKAVLEGTITKTAFQAAIRAINNGATVNEAKLIALGG